MIQQQKNNSSKEMGKEFSFQEKTSKWTPDTWKQIQPVHL